MLAEERILQSDRTPALLEVRPGLSGIQHIVCMYKTVLLLGCIEIYKAKWNCMNSTPYPRWHIFYFNNLANSFYSYIMWPHIVTFTAFSCSAVAWRPWQSKRPAGTTETGPRCSGQSPAGWAQETTGRTTAGESTRLVLLGELLDVIKMTDLKLNKQKKCLNWDMWSRKIVSRCVLLYFWSFIW